MRPEKLLILAILMAAVGGCARPPAFYETMGDDGVITRVEAGMDQEPELASSEVRASMESYKAQRMALASDAGAAGAAISARPHGGSAASDDYDPFIERDCPPEGSASSARYKQLNRLKNRITAPSISDMEPVVTLAALRAPGNDEDRWSTGHAATIEGYVRSAKGTGKETCNCKASSRRLTDTHLDIVADANDDGYPVVAEITPPMRLIHEHHGLEDWSSAAIKSHYEGRRVRISGWLFFDEHHRTGAENTDPGDMRGEKNWRATCWEIHPITHIELAE